MPTETPAMDETLTDETGRRLDSMESIVTLMNGKMDGLVKGQQAGQEELNNHTEQEMERYRAIEDSVLQIVHQLDEQHRTRITFYKSVQDQVDTLESFRREQQLVNVQQAQFNKETLTSLKKGNHSFQRGEKRMEAMSEGINRNSKDIRAIKEGQEEMVKALKQIVENTKPVVEDHKKMTTTWGVLTELKKPFLWITGIVTAVVVGLWHLLDWMNKTGQP